MISFIAMLTVLCGLCAGSGPDVRAPGGTEAAHRRAQPRGCAERMRFQQVFEQPGPNTTGFGMVFNGATSWTMPRPAQKVNYHDIIYAGGGEPDIDVKKRAGTAVGSYDAVQVDPTSGDPISFVGSTVLTFNDGSALVTYGVFAQIFEFIENTTTVRAGGTNAIIGGTGRFDHRVGGSVTTKSYVVNNGPFKGAPASDLQVCVKK